jgi:hypothetical protein
VYTKLHTVSHTLSETCEVTVGDRTGLETLQVGDEAFVYLGNLTRGTQLPATNHGTKGRFASCVICIEILK